MPQPPTREARPKLVSAVRSVQALVPAWLRPVLAAVGPAVLILAVQMAVWPVKLGVMVRGGTIGLLTALIAIGMALVYRANRVINFAQADLGYIPGLLGVMMVAVSGINYFVGFIAGLASAIVLGALVELVIIRRFFRSARLILTVATIGLSQLLAALALFLASAWDAPSRSTRIDFPWDYSFDIDPLVFEADYIVAWIVGPLAMLAVWFFLQRTLVGTAIRAAADSADRAGLLGVPVKRLHTIVWSVAATLAFIGIWLTAGIIGLPVGAALAFTVLLRSLTALMLGNLTNLPAIALSAIALGVLEIAVDFKADSTSQSKAVLAAVVILALLIRSVLNRSDSRAEKDSTSTWQAAEEVRPVPKELRSVPEIMAVRTAIAVVVGGAILALPHFLGTADTFKASAVVIFGIIGVSVIVLTGWSGQVSLGQMAFVAFGSAVTAKLTHEWNVDLILGVARLVGGRGGGRDRRRAPCPAPALALPGGQVAGSSRSPPRATSSTRTSSRGSTTTGSSGCRSGAGSRSVSPIRMYYLSLAGLGIVLLAMRGRAAHPYRAGAVGDEGERAGRPDLRDQPPAGQADRGSRSRARSPPSAGGLFAYDQHAFDPRSFEPVDSISVFTMGVIGGLGTLAGGVFGAVYLKSLGWFLPAEWRFFASGHRCAGRVADHPERHRWALLPGARPLAAVGRQATQPDRAEACSPMCVPPRPRRPRSSAATPPSPSQRPRRSGP